jgi:hypothetical protein
LSAIKARDGFAKNLTALQVSEVYKDLAGIKANTLLANVVTLQTFWGKKELTRALKKPSYMDNVHRLGFDTSLVIKLFIVFTKKKKKAYTRPLRK